MITLENARKIIAAAERKANELGQPMNIAVADTGGNLVAHVRMDGAWIGSIDIAINKAFTRDLGKNSQSGGQFFGIHASNHGRVMIFAGGVPLRRAGRVVGAVGVSGGSGEQDHSVAEAGAQAFESLQGELKSWQVIVVLYTSGRGRWKFKASSFPSWWILAAGSAITE